MPTRLQRYYGAHHLHFITASCYHRLPLLGSASRRDLFLEALEQARQRYQFVVVGYVVMPEHFHLLMSEPERGDPSVVLKVIKQRFARLIGKPPGDGPAEQFQQKSEDQPSRVWQKRFYDFNVWTAHKEREKLHYMHRNPVKRGLVDQAEQWVWSSYRSYAFGEPGTVRVNTQEWPLTIRSKPREKFPESTVSDAPLIRTERE